MIRYEEAIKSYARSEELNRLNIWKQYKANDEDEDEFYRNVFNSSILGAHDVINKMNENNCTFSFLKSSIDFGCKG